MGCVDLIEPVVGINAFSMFMTYPLLQQYVHRRLWMQLSGSPFPTDWNNIHCADNLTLIHAEVQKEASLFFLYTELCFLFPSLLSSPLLVSYSDVWGRKAAIVPPLVGNLLFTLCYFVVSGFSLSLSYLLGAAFITGILGGSAALTGGCFAYVADRCEQGSGDGGVARGISQDRMRRGDNYEESDSGYEERQVGEDGSHDRVRDRCEERGETGTDESQDTGTYVYTRAKTVRMASLDMILGLLSGLASLSTGFFIHAAGFTWPGLTAALLHLLNLGYVLFVLRESLNPPSTTLSSSSGFSPKVLISRCPKGKVLISRLQGVYLIFASGTRRKKAAVGLMMAAFALYKISQLGGMSVFILYELNKPLCWNEVLIGCSSALTTVIHVGSFAGVSVLSHCLRDTHIILLGLLSVSTGLLIAAFAKTTLVMFLVRLPLILSAMPSAVLRSMMSKAALSSEQGALFAGIAFVEMLSMGVALMVFNSIYATTVSWFSGFSFLLALCLSIIAAALIGVLMYFSLDEEEEDMSRLTAEEDDIDTDCSRGSLNLTQWECD
ncbi:solute carrier family 46 member 3 [Myripristis murdjan]|uniref:solute carrier family 46 member 3 n=1 Tax=Myripristis murdjan TaxID=586833 RepID=UPI0011760D41|nr:solute carrier family 46 member 3-like [Myripristis murdjan]